MICILHKPVPTLVYFLLCPTCDSVTARNRLAQRNPGKGVQNTCIAHRREYNVSVHVIEVSQPAKLPTYDLGNIPRH